MRGQAGWCAGPRPRRLPQVLPPGRWPAAPAGSAQGGWRGHRAARTRRRGSHRGKRHDDVGVAGDGCGEDVPVLGVALEALEVGVEAHDLGLRERVLHGVEASSGTLLLETDLGGEGAVGLLEDRLAPAGLEQAALGAGQQEAGEVVGDEDAGVEDCPTTHRVVTTWSSSLVPVRANSASPAALRAADASMNCCTDARLIRRCVPGFSNSRAPSWHSLTTVGRLT